MAKWIALAIALAGFFLSIASIVKRYGHDEALLENMAKDIERSFKYHDEHFQHKQDSDRHWSGRERDDLGRRLEHYEEVQQEILREVRLIGKGLKGNGDQ